MANERATDQFVRDMLREIGVKRPWEQDGGPQRKREALKGASKTASGKGEGKPEFAFVSGKTSTSPGFLVLIEDKKDVTRTRLIQDGEVLTNTPPPR